MYRIDFRFQLKERFPWLLEKYYQLGELGKKENIVIRQTDNQTWALAKPESKDFWVKKISILIA